MSRMKLAVSSRDPFLWWNKSVNNRLNSRGVSYTGACAADINNTILTLKVIL